MKIIITESRLAKILLNYIDISFEGFDNLNFDWGEFNCGWGVCCDPYAIVFSLQNSYADEYLFKLVNDKYYDDDGDYPSSLKIHLPEPCHYAPNIHDNDFNTIILNEDFYERLKSLFGDLNTWGDSLLSIINNLYGTKAKNILYL